MSKAVNSGAVRSFSDHHSAGVRNKGCFATGASGSWNRTAFEMCTTVMSCYTCKSMCQYKPGFELITPSGHILYKCISRPIEKNIIKFFLGQMGDLARWEVVFLIWSCELFYLRSWDDWVTLAEQTKMFHAVPWGRWNTSTCSAELLHLWMRSVSGYEGSVTAWKVQHSVEWRLLSQGRRSFQPAAQLGSRAKSILQGELWLTVVSCFVSGCAET